MMMYAVAGLVFDDVESLLMLRTRVLSVNEYVEDCEIDRGLVR